MHLSLISYSLLLPVLAAALPSFSSPSASLSELDSLSSVDTASSTSDDLYRYQNKVYLIRHGEKGPRGETGLNSKGKKRAKCLRKVSPHVRLSQPLTNALVVELVTDSS